MDYSSFRADNTSQFLYNALFDDLSENFLTSLRFFLTTATKLELGIFPIEVPYFGVMRGHILSILKCSQRTLSLTESNEICTHEVQCMTDQAERVFVDPSNNVIQQTFVEEDCNPDGFGDVYEVRDVKSQLMVAVTQEKNIRAFNEITGFLQDNGQLFVKKIHLEDLLQYKDFQQSGVYSAEYIQARAEYLQR